MAVLIIEVYCCIDAFTLKWYFLNDEKPKCFPDDAINEEVEEGVEDEEVIRNEAKEMVPEGKSIAFFYAGT